MIKRNLGIYLFMVAPLIAQSQNYFEGKIVFEYEVKAKTSNVDIKKLKNYLGTGSTLFFKQGNYYFQHNDGTYEFEFYNQKTNKIYSKKRNNDTIYWRDCSQPGKVITDLEFVPKKEKVLGILCDQLKIQYKESLEVHYYNADSIPLNPNWFKDFKLNGENLIDEKEKSVYLKKESEYARFTVISTAIKISREPIDNMMFAISENSILIEKK